MWFSEEISVELDNGGNVLEEYICTPNANDTQNKIIHF